MKHEVGKLDCLLQEGGRLLKDSMREEQALRVQRDDLLAAARAVLDFTGTTALSEATDEKGLLGQLRAAIAKATGEA